MHVPKIFCALPLPRKDATNCLELLMAIEFSLILVICDLSWQNFNADLTLNWKTAAFLYVKLY